MPSRPVWRAKQWWLLVCRAAEQAKQALTADFASERAALLKELESSKQNMHEAKQAFAREMEAARQQSEGALDARPFAEQYNEVD